MTPCASECIRPHAHTERCPAVCAVTEPVPAEHGLLCGRCHRRLADCLGAREGLGQPGRESHGLAWIWENLTAAHPIVASSSGGIPGPRAIDDPEAERMVAVVSLRADIRNVLLSWCMDIADRTGLAGPVVGFEESRIKVLRAQAWLLANLPSLEACPGAPDAVRELTELHSRGHAMNPWRQSPTRVEWLPCRCGKVGTIHDHGDLMKCWACGAEYLPEHAARLQQVMAKRFGEEVPA